MVSFDAITTSLGCPVPHDDIIITLPGHGSRVLQFVRRQAGSSVSSVMLSSSAGGEDSRVAFSLALIVVGCCSGVETVYASLSVQ